MLTIGIWLGTASLYLVFWLWYVGVRRPLGLDETDRYMKGIAAQGVGDEQLSELRQFLEADTGKSFVMANILKLYERPPEVPQGASAHDTSRKLLERYAKPFKGAILRRACHPVFMGTAAGKAIERWGVDDTADWSSAGMIRYRSRRDFAEILLLPAFTENHPFKLAALEKTMAFPTDPWFQPGGVPVTVALILALIAALLQTAF